MVIYRVGVHIPIPGVDPDQVALLFEQNQGTILSLFNAFAGGGLERMSFFALGVIPYISASIIMQMMVATIPTLDQLRKEGEHGRNQITQYTRYLNFAVASIQGFGIATVLSSQNLTYISGPALYISAVSSFVAGAVFLMWVGEQINERGIGNGMSILIFTSIISGIPSFAGQAFELARQGQINPIFLMSAVAFIIATVGVVVFVERGQRKIPIQHPGQRMIGRGLPGQRMSSHLPLKVNMSGVIPAIFASSILLFPASLAQWFGQGRAWPGSAIFRFIWPPVSPCT